MAVGSIDHRWALSIVLALILSLVQATPGNTQEAGTITFIGQDGNVWIMAAEDPTTARQVTNDADPQLPYAAPVQSDDGVVYALTQDGFGDIVTLDQTGTPLAPPFRPSTQDKIDDLDLSPDGQVLAVTSAQSNQTGGGFVFTFETDFVAAAGGAPTGPQDVPEGYPSFISDDQVVYTPYYESPYDIAGFTTYDLDGGGQQPWQDTCPDVLETCDILVEPQVSRSSERLAAPGSDVNSEEVLVVYEMTGPPPAPLQRDCAFTAPQSSTLSRPDWSADGNALVWSVAPEYDFEQPPEAGVWVATGFDSGCQSAFAGARLVVPGASWPDWSPAPLGTAPGTPDPVDPGPGTPTPPPAGQLTDGARLDGGGSADPIGQAIATSQLLFADGSADRVVLATADRFPDALAGAALAGDDGPILLTAGLGALDPRVGAEIERVTGGQGVVLVLGGNQAVSDEAAAQAAAAAGNQPCTAPLPASCRFAGTGREHTAALIGQVVLAEHPGDVALVARGDEFADAITGGAFAAAAGVPILLTPSDMVSPPTAQFLQEQGISEAIVLGGTAAIDEPTYQALPVAQRSRVAGAERTATAAAIATDLWAARGLGAGGVVLVNVRAVDGWQTALAAAVASAVHDAPQLGTENPPAPLSDATRAVLADVVGPIMAFGGADLVSDDQMDQAAVARG